MPEYSMFLAIKKQSFFTKVFVNMKQIANFVIVNLL